jgi:GDP-L-fucose synthase
MNFKGKLVLDLTKPSGTQRKKLILKKINKFNWKAKTSLEDGLNLTIKSLMDSGLYK